MIILFFGNLEISDVCIRQEGVLLVRVEQAEVLHDDGDQEIEHDVGDDHVEAAEEHDGGHEVAAIYLREKKLKVYFISLEGWIKSSLKSLSFQNYYVVSTCISTISKFDTIQCRSNFLYRILTRHDIYRIFHIEFLHDIIHHIEFR